MLAAPQSKSPQQIKDIFLTMFAKLTVISAIAILAAASPTPQVSQCNTGEMQCCNSVQNVNLTTLSQLGGLLGINVQGLVPTIGLTCSGISVSIRNKR